MGWAFWRRGDQAGEAKSPAADSAVERRSGEDPTAALRVRARQRLIGAAALLLTVVVVVPMLLDPGPRPVSDAIPIDIPSEKAPFTPRLALPPLPEPAVVPVPPPDVAAPALQSPKAGAADSSPRSGDQAAATLPSQSESGKPVPATRTADLPTADKGAAAKPDADSKAAAAKAGRFMVQAAALGSEQAAREMTERLRKAGLASFTERVDAKDGTRYRVRLGPFTTRDEAERVRARLRALGINANLVAP